jgi:hypothetical protein
MIAVSGTYMLHRTDAQIGTEPRKVKPTCGQSVRQSYLSVVKHENEQAMLESKMTKLCKKCFN